MSSAEKSKRSIGKYDIYETLGKGGYSWVKKGVDTETGAIVALKFMNRANDQWALEQAEQVRTEIKSLTKIRHENVMKLYAYNLSAKYPLDDGSGETIKTILLVLEYCPGGELFDILYYADKLPENIARTYFQQMMHGLQAVHKAGITHRDLKPQNLLLDANFQLKITDFGLSKIIENNEDKIMKTTYVGTKGYQAPELLKNQKYTNACDIFSIGVVLFILLAGYPPFEAAHKTDKWYRPICAGEWAKFWHVHRGAQISDAAKNLIENMICYRPAKRFVVDDILAHKWFGGETVKQSDLKPVLLKKFQQARDNRKKDSKKMQDIQESRHRAFNPTGDLVSTIANKPAKPWFMGKRNPLRSLTTFYTNLNPYKAIWSVKFVVVDAMKGAVIYNPNSTPDHLEAVVGVIEDGREISYKFQIHAYQDPDRFETLLDFMPVHSPDNSMLTRRRIMHDLTGSLYLYGVLKYEIPAVVVDNMSKEDFTKSGLTPMGPDPAEKDDDENKNDDEPVWTGPKPMHVEADLTSIGEVEMLMKKRGLSCEAAQAIVDAANEVTVVAKKEVDIMQPDDCAVKANMEAPALVKAIV